MKRIDEPSPRPPSSEASPSACSMAGLVEARADGRLDDRERRSLERHVATCASCTALAREIDRVRDLLREPALPPVTPLEHQRARLALLRAGSLVAREPAPKESAFARLSRWGISGTAALGIAGVAGIALAATVTVGVASRSRDAAAHAVPRAASMGAIVTRNAVASSRSSPRHAPTSRRAERTETRIASSEGARFERRSEDGVERIALEDGWIELEVRKLKPGERFLVVTRDAEVEVRGTIFDVEAHRGRMAHVNVREGKVELRRGGDVALIAEGDAWDLTKDAKGELPPLAEPSPPSGAPSAPVAAVSTTPSIPSIPSAAGVPAGPTGASSSATGSTSATRPMRGSRADRISTEFDEAVKALGRGDYGAARDRLDAFRIVHPDDERADLASFLAIISLHRAGRREDARAAGRRYLDLYPKGDRRAQVERLVQGSGEL